MIPFQVLKEKNLHMSATGKNTQGLGLESHGFSKSILRPQGFGFREVERSADFSHPYQKDLCFSGNVQADVTLKYLCKILFFKSFEQDATELIIITFQCLIWNFRFFLIDLLL